MATTQTGTVLRQIGRLFGAGTVAGLTDAQLVARFRTDRDEAAFMALVARHGPMVMAVCRGVLRDDHAAEDAFQATFLILVRKAGALWVGESLGGWLHRVAHRVARQAHADGLRRRARELKAARTAAPAEHSGGPDDDLRSLLHEEIDRLPERLRLPVVLCDLEGLTRDQAAERLRWTEGTVRGRLAKARAKLRERLTRRRVGLSSAALAAALTRGASAAPVPEPLLIATIRAAVGQGTAIAADVLTARVIQAMFAAKLKAAAAVALGLAALASAGWFLAPRAPEGEKPPVVTEAPPVQQVVAPPDDGPGATVAIRGRVVDPDGRPVDRATVRFANFWTRSTEAAASGPDGRFDFQVPRGAFVDFFRGGKDEARLYAMAEGFGFAWEDVAVATEGSAEVTLRLVADDVPIVGRIVDLEGRPVAGALVRSDSIWVAREGDLSAWIARMQAPGSQGHWQTLDVVPLKIAATTGPDGRFTLAGIGRERLADLFVSGPGVAAAEVYAMTRGGPEVRVTKTRLNLKDLVYHRAHFVHALAPGRAIAGVVRDKDTGEPIAGVKIDGAVGDDRQRTLPQRGVEATTDAEGRYQLAGLIPGHAYGLSATPAEGSPYPNATFHVPAAANALAPLTFDFTMKRGVLIQGRVTDKSTGKPVRGYVQTYTFLDNPHVKDFPGYSLGNEPFARFGPDGRFAVATLPGRGLVAVRSDVTRYLGARGVENIKGLNEEKTYFDTYPQLCSVTSFHAIVEINPDGKSEALALELQVDPGQSLSGTVVDPDGRPIGGTKGSGLNDLMGISVRTLESPEFEVRSLDPAKPRRLFLAHEGRKLAGSVLVRGDEGGPLTVRLEPWGAVTGRVVDEDGEPRLKMELLANVDYDKFDPERGLVPGDNARVVVDRDGRFQIEGLVPGLKYQAWASDGLKLLGKVYEGVQVGPGATKDLGNVTVRPLK